MDQGELVKAALESAKDGGPFEMKNLVPTLWMLLVSLLSGAVSFYQKVKAGRTRLINISELIGEMFTSGVVGIVTFWICRAYGINEYLTAAGVAISGHMGARAIFLVEHWLEAKLKG